MKILSKLRRSIDLRRLRQAARREPGPGTIGALAEALIAAGRLEDAYEVAEQGIASYPASERLALVCRFAKRERLASLIAGLRREIAQNPDPDLYRQLAEIHLELGEEDRALKLCEQCLEQYPVFEHAHLIIGRIRLERFFVNRVAQDALEADRQLRRTCKINPRSAEAIALLAQLYFSVGARNTMVEVLQASIAANPGDRELRDLARAAAAPRLWERAVDAPLEDDLYEEDADSFPDLARRVEIRGVFRNPPHLFPSSSSRESRRKAASWARLDVRRLHQSVLEASRTPGLRNLAVLNEAGHAIAGHSDEEYMDRAAFEELVREVRDTAQDASRRMDLGRLGWLTIEAEAGAVTVHQVREICLGVFHDGSIRASAAPGMLQELASRNYVAPAGGSHA